MVLQQTFPRNALIICFLNFLHLAESQILDYPILNLSTNWVQRISAPNLVIHAITNTKMKTIVVRHRSGMAYACGFLCSDSCRTFLFGVVLLPIENGTVVMHYEDSPQAIWLSNRNNPIGINSTLEFTSTSNLILKDSAGSIVWSANTGGRSIVGINMTETGNLVLFNATGSVVWQSFDYPTDTLVPGQQLHEGQKLIASESNGKYTEGIYSCLMRIDGAHLFIGSNPPVEYTRVKKTNLNIAGNSTSNSLVDYYLKLEPDGHLRKHYLGSEWGTTADMLAGSLSYCDYPMACGKYGICQDGQCSCPLFKNASTRYFQQIDSRRPNLGCSPVTAIDCNESSSHHLVKVENVMYFTFLADISPIDRTGCLNACLRNCSCKLAIFRYEAEPSDGDCYLPSEVYSLRSSNEYSSIYLMSVFVKVQIKPSKTSILKPQPAASRRHSFRLVFGLAFGAMVLVVIAMAFAVVKMRMRLYDRETDDNSFDSCAHGMPTRFSLDELKMATENFSVKLGEGGSGSVFQGSLKDGTKIAVKCLEGVGPAKKSFLAEVSSIGNIHHVNLVRLIGYSSEKSQRFLVYEHMANGSLDKWIDSRKQEFPLGWECRKQIVIDIAKGLAYLHEDCRQKIVHLDVKPENILLGENFEAKLSDFGISKLLSRGQSKIFTSMRGTPGYLAPEWLSSIVTEKADVYSFGVVIMEILCGRKIIDESQPKDQVHLLTVFTRKAQEGKWLEMVDKSCEDMVSRGPEVLKLMQVAVWCLQNDFLIRPAMSLVVKVLEGVVDVDLTHLEYNFIAPYIFAASLPHFHNIENTH